MSTTENENMTIKCMFKYFFQKHSRWTSPEAVLCDEPYAGEHYHGSPQHLASLHLHGHPFKNFSTNLTSQLAEEGRRSDILSRYKNYIWSDQRMLTVAYVWKISGMRTCPVICWGCFKLIICKALYDNCNNNKHGKFSLH